MKTVHCEARSDAVIVGCTFHASLWMSLSSSGPLSVLAGLLTALSMSVGAVSLLHHGGHRHFARNAFVNAAWVTFACPAGFWVEYWGMKHRVHHRVPATYPEDLYTSATRLFRFHPLAPHGGLHRWQHVYILPAYALYWLIDQGSQLNYLVTGRALATTPPTRDRVLSYLVEKVLFLLAIGAYPFVFGSSALVRLLLVGTVASLLSGLLVSLNHISVGAYASLEDMDWREYVAKSTVNYAIGSRLVGFATGGLNTHSVHHLQPNLGRAEMRSRHQQLWGAEGEVIVFPNLRGAIVSHFNALRWLGEGGSGTRIGRLKRADEEHTDPAG